MHTVAAASSLWQQHLHCKSNLKTCVAVMALSIRQPYALLIVYGLKPAEFRNAKSLFKEGEEFWVVSGKAGMPTWDGLLQVLAEHHVSLKEMEDALGATLLPTNYLHFFPRQTVLGKVSVACAKESVLSFYHSLNPFPDRWQWAMELCSIYRLQDCHRHEVNYGNVGRFRLNSSTCNILSCSDLIACRDVFSIR
jgi:hypothetical protein